jgi:hypothetical protein
MVLDELRKVLEFSRDFFAARGRAILAGHLDCQLRYMKSAELYQDIENREEELSTTGINVGSIVVELLANASRSIEKDNANGND